MYTPPLPDKAPAPKAASVEGSREVKYTTKSAHMVMNQRAMYDGLTLKIRKEIKRHGHGHDDDDDDDDCVSIRVGTAISTLVWCFVWKGRSDQIGGIFQGGLGGADLVSPSTTGILCRRYQLGRVVVGPEYSGPNEGRGPCSSRTRTAPKLLVRRRTASTSI